MLPGGSALGEATLGTPRQCEGAGSQFSVLVKGSHKDAPAKKYAMNVVGDPSEQTNPTFSMARDLLIVDFPK